MDLRSIIRVLSEEKARLDEVIHNLETLGASKGINTSTTKRRGRKAMPESERKVVAERMRKYWESKRKK